MHYVDQAQDAAHMNVNQRRKPKILDSISLQNFFMMRCKTSFKAK